MKDQTVLVDFLNFSSYILYSLLLCFSVDVGYEYDGCERVFWHTQAATLAGYDVMSSDVGDWSLHMHHIYNFQDGQPLGRLIPAFS